ncbi:lantibiotic protection ABC transporter ATP-binding protein [Acetobacterium bakii]|uniref:Lantibiotic ABC transporter ATP-binding protein n=1 Tax=Acetobacterium bakii TaxID=52689 RepID=A0A0L6TVR0_9FIRM|nr:lantibiotic protection ABC transporter ATP-binding protein [Acetobacterium bakii]KNZ40336.1 lantibiotic ABC transporter ATP-binding protein [Acetobacterium bakii]
MENYILETRHLTKQFKAQKVVNDLSIGVKENSIYGLLGPNGAGKSTLLKMITGLLKPTQGNILFQGAAWERRNLSKIGALIENPGIYPNLTAMENLGLACTLYELPRSRAEEVLAIIGLENPGKKKVRNFSMGMKQRLGIGMAIINNPKLLILDEPTNGLDPLGIEELRELIRSFPSKGMTVILSSHILTEVALIADEVTIIANGVVGYHGEVKKDEDLEKIFMDVIGKNRGAC